MWSKVFLLYGLFQQCKLCRNFLLMFFDVVCWPGLAAWLNFLVFRKQFRNWVLQSRTVVEVSSRSIARSFVWLKVICGPLWRLQSPTVLASWTLGGPRKVLIGLMLLWSSGNPKQAFQFYYFEGEKKARLHPFSLSSVHWIFRSCKLSLLYLSE